MSKLLFRLRPFSFSMILRYKVRNRQFSRKQIRTYHANLNDYVVHWFIPVTIPPLYLSWYPTIFEIFIWLMFSGKKNAIVSFKRFPPMSDFIKKSSHLRSPFILIELSQIQWENQSSRKFSRSLRLWEISYVYELYSVLIKNYQ